MPTRQLVALILLIGAIYILLTVGIYTGLTSRVVGATDFYSRWEGARALWLRGENPYAESVSRAIQMTYYGRWAEPTEDQLAFAYPIYAALFAAPLIALPYAYAQAGWMALLTLALMGSVIALVNVLHYSPRPSIFIALVLGGLLYYPSVRGIFLGQYALLAFFFLALTRWAIHTRRDVLAGVCLALATVKPQLAIFLAPFIVLWALRHARWRVAISAGVTLLTLSALGWLWLPNWHLEFWRALNAYAGYMRVGPPLQTALALILPDALATWFAFIGALGLLALCAWLWWRARADVTRAFDLTALVTTLIAIRIGSPDQVVLLFPLLRWIIRLLQNRRAARALALATIIIILPWWVFFATLRGDTEHPGVTIVLPLVVLTFWFIFERDIFRVNEARV